MNLKMSFIVGTVLLLAAFLLGFIPQYLKGRALDSQLSAVRQQLILEREHAQMGELGLLCGHVYLESSLSNYGMAGQYSSKFFDEVQAMMSQGPNVTRQSFLQNALAQRDAITAGLAKADPATLPVVQNLFQSVLANAEKGSNAPPM